MILFEDSKGSDQTARKQIDKPWSNSTDANAGLDRPINIYPKTFFHLAQLLLFNLYFSFG